MCGACATCRLEAARSRFTWRCAGSCARTRRARVTFAGQAEGLTARYQRWSVPLAGLLSQIAVELAGRAGTRLAAALGISVHHATLLRLVIDMPEPRLSAAPQVLGVDDFALRKRHVYATILVDAAGGRAIDILPGREAGPLADWLKAHPGAQVICRDRAERMPTVPVRAFPARCRSLTAGTCGGTSPGIPPGPSPGTAPASGRSPQPLTSHRRHPSPWLPPRRSRLRNHGSRQRCVTSTPPSRRWPPAGWACARLACCGPRRPRG